MHRWIMKVVSVVRGIKPNDTHSNRGGQQIEVDYGVIHANELIFMKDNPADCLC